MTGVGRVTPTPPCSHPRLWPAHHRGRNGVESGPGQLDVDAFGVGLGLPPTALLVPSQLGSDERGHLGGGGRRPPGVPQRGPGPPVEHIGHRAGHLVPRGVDGLGLEVAQSRAPGGRAARDARRPPTARPASLIRSGRPGGWRWPPPRWSDPFRPRALDGRAPGLAPRSRRSLVTQGSRRRPSALTTTSTVSSAIFR